MVYSVERGEGGERELVMGMGAAAGQRWNNSKPPLHNFDLPFLKWGNQKHLRCMKISDSSASTSTTTTDGLQRRSSRSPPSKFHYEIRQFKKPKQRNDSVEEVREKLMLDFKTAADKMKDAIFSSGNEEAPPADTTTTATEQEVRPWNLRTRRAACKSPIAVAGNSVTGKGFIIDSPLRSESSKSPRLRENEDDTTQQARPKLSVALSKKEIEEDFMALVSHRPPRRPKKRSRYVQKQLDVSQSS